MLNNKLIKQFLICILLLASFSSMANDSARRGELIKVIDQELREVTRLNKQTRTSNPDLLLRMAELLLEKARLIKELENAQFVQLTPEKRQRTNKKNFFNKSNSYFSQAQKTCQLILKRFPRFKGKSDVYYIMAYNAKEFNEDKKAEAYFSRSVKSSKKANFTSTRSEIALAEIYFNQGQYKKAIPLYVKAFKNKEFRDKWYTKDSYNLAWSYYRAGSKTRAISLMREAYRLSKSPNYVDMSYSIERDLAYFYTDSGQVTNAVNFYKDIGKNISSNLLKVSTYLINRGKYSQAEKTLKQALKHKTSESEEIEINIKLLSLYEKFGKYDSHLKVSETLLKYHKQKKLDAEQVKILEYQLKRTSGIVQKQVGGKQYKKQKKTLYRKARLAVGYFNLLSEFDPLNAHKYMFLGGETYFAAGMNNSAVETYSKSLKKAQEINSAKYIKLSNEGMIAALAGKNISKGSKNKYIEVAYLNSLRENPKTKQADKIYQRLFNLYFDRGDISSCEKTLISYRSNFPRSHSTQEAMLAKIMDHYKKKGDVAGIKAWVTRINSGEFRVSPNYAKKVKMTVLTMQFEKVENASSKGDKKKALALYVALYKDPSTDSEAKKNAAYNISTLFHELGDTHRSYGWAKRALSHMTSKNVKKFQGSFLVIANDLFNHQKFSESVDLYSSVLDKLCPVKSSNKSVFLKNAVVVALANNEDSKARDILDSAYRCNINTTKLDELELEFLNYEIEKKNWSSVVKQVEKLERSKLLYPELIYPLGKVRNAYLAAGRVSNAKSVERDILKYYGQIRNKKEIQLEALDEVASIKIQGLDQIVAQLKSFELTFPGDKFNGLLKSKFSILDRLTSEAISVMSIGSGRGIIKSYTILIDSYNYLIKEVESFEPPGKSPEYIASFKNSMKPIIQQLLNKSSDFKKEAITQINNNKILSEDNGLILYGTNLAPEYIIQNNGIIMDRGGQR